MRVNEKRAIEAALDDVLENAKCVPEADLVNALKAAIESGTSAESIVRSAVLVAALRAHGLAYSSEDDLDRGSVILHAQGFDLGKATRDVLVKFLRLV